MLFFAAPFFSEIAPRAFLFSLYTLYVFFSRQNAHQANPYRSRPWTRVSIILLARTKVWNERREWSLRYVRKVSGQPRAPSRKKDHCKQRNLLWVSFRIVSGSTFNKPRQKRADSKISSFTMRRAPARPHGRDMKYRWTGLQADLRITNAESQRSKAWCPACSRVDGLEIQWGVAPQQIPSTVCTEPQKTFWKAFC